MMLINVIDNYLTQKRSLGIQLESPERLLRRFCRAMGNPEIEEITPEMVVAFLHGSGRLSAAWTFRYRILSGFYQFAISRGHAAFSPLPTTIPKLPPQQTPYVYSTEELRRLLDATSILKVRHRPQVPAIYRTLLLLLYGTGMRVGEALRLVLRDLDLTEQIIIVRDTKFYKTRLVPVGPKLTCELAVHMERRRLLPLTYGQESPLFTAHDGRPGHGPTSGSFPCSSMSVEPPKSAALSANFDHHDCMIFVIRPPCIE
jgi:integrase